MQLATGAILEKNPPVQHDNQITNL